MRLFKKNPESIPPVSQPDPPSSYRSVKSSASTYVASRDGDPYNISGNQPLGLGQYGRNSDNGDSYSRGQTPSTEARKELFDGHNPNKEGSGRFVDGPNVSSGAENEEDVEGIKQQTRFLKQDSVTSTRNALRLAREAEETARNTVGRLGDQSDKLANTERHLDIAKTHAAGADDKTDELKKLNRSIFRPVVAFGSERKRAAQEAKILARYEEEKDERERTMHDIRETQNRLGRATTYGNQAGEETLLTSGSRVQKTSAQKEVRKRYQFEATASDDEMEDELDDNLDEIGDAVTRLKALSTAMGEEVDKQNSRIDRIGDKTSSLDNRIFRNTERLKRIK